MPLPKYTEVALKEYELHGPPHVVICLIEVSIFDTLSNFRDSDCMSKVLQAEFSHSSYEGADGIFHNQYYVYIYI